MKHLNIILALICAALLVGCASQQAPTAPPQPTTNGTSTTAVTPADNPPPVKECVLSLCDCKCHPAGQTPEDLGGGLCGINCRGEFNVSGCAEENGACITVYENVTSEPSLPPAPPAPTVTLGSFADCSFLTAADATAVIGMEMKEGASFPQANSCSKNWLDTKTSMSAAVALQASKKSPEGIAADMTLGKGLYESIDQIGDYDTTWDPNGNAVNFGKGEYKFQLQCSFDQCSKEKAIALAKIVVTRTP